MYRHLDSYMHRIYPRRGPPHPHPHPSASRNCQRRAVVTGICRATADQLNEWTDHGQNLLLEVKRKNSTFFMTFLYSPVLSESARRLVLLYIFAPRPGPYLHPGPFTAPQMAFISVLFFSKSRPIINQFQLSLWCGLAPGLSFLVPFARCRL
jgi:hypothetical protein